MVGVNAVKTFSQCRLRSKARVFKGALALGFWSSVWPRKPYPAGKDLQNRLPNVVPGTRRLLSALLLIDVPQQSHIADNVVGTISLAVEERCEPLIVAGGGRVPCLELL